MPDNTIVTVLGMKGSGKTTLVKEMVSDWDRVVIVDANGEYEDGTIAWGLEESVNALQRYENAQRFTLSLRLERKEDSLKILRLTYLLSDVLVVIDEASLYSSAAFMPDEIGRLVRFGRHKQISLFFVARRASEIPRDITADSDIVVSFRQQEPRDKEYLMSLFGEKAEKVDRLPQYQVMVFGNIEKAPLALIERMDSDTG